MENKNQALSKIAQTGLVAALCFVAFTYLKIPIPMPGGGATALHIGNAICVLGALLLGGVYGGLAGAIGMTIADLIDPMYITYAPKTMILKFCIGLIVGLIAHKYAKINESNDKKYIFKWSVIASIGGLAFNVIMDPVVGYFYKKVLLGVPSDVADIMAKWSAGATFVNAIVSIVLVAVVYNAIRPIFIKTGLLHLGQKAKAVS